MTSTRNVAVVGKYYNLEAGSFQVSTEAWLSELEHRAAAVIERLISNPDTISALSESEQIDLARYVAAQLFRVPAFRRSERSMREDTVGWVQSLAKSHIEKTLPKDTAQELWKEWETKPEEWWLQQEQPFQDAGLTTFMLQEVQGWANLLRAMDWRVGRCGSRILYTSDNPISAYSPPVRPWWAYGAAIWEKGYVFPLSTGVLLWIYPLGYEPDIPPTGRRWRKEFGQWESSVALHVISREATRFLYGSGPYVTRECAASCLYRIDSFKVADAIRLQGYDPRPPKRPDSLARLLKDEVADPAAAIG